MPDGRARRGNANCEGNAAGRAFRDDEQCEDGT